MVDPESGKKTINEFNIQARLLAEVVKRILDRKAHIYLSEVAAFKLKPITEFKRRMRVSSLEKFEDSTYISTVNFYSSEKDLDNKKAVGTLVIYIEEPYVVELLKKLDYPIEDEDSQPELADACGTVCNLIAGNFKSGLTQLGYIELAMSHFSSYRNEILNGVEYPADQKELYEISFEIRKRRRIVAELVMGDVPRTDD